MKAILVNPIDRTVSEITLKNAYPDANKAMDCDTITTGMEYEDVKAVLYVDDEGLLKSDNPCFRIEGGHQPFAGKAVMLGYNDEGDSVDSPLSLEDVRGMVVWTDLIVR